MPSSIDNFVNALCGMGCSSVSRLARAIPLYGDDGKIDVHCTSYFAEARVEMDGEPYIVMMPLHSGAIMEFVGRIRSLKGTALYSMVDYQLLRDELSCDNYTGENSCEDLVLYRIPRGELLSDLMLRGEVDWPRLIESSYSTQALFAQARVCHNNLKASNIVVGEEYELFAIRFTDSTCKVSAEDVEREFHSLREWMASECGAQAHDCVDKGAESKPYRGVNFDNMWGEFEGLRRFTSGGLYGYADSAGREVIPAIYHWCEHFREGRAEVETATGMGLINNRGEVVIEPINQIVEYSVDIGYSRVKRGEQWALFDHNGGQLTPFSADYISERDMLNFKNKEKILNRF